MEKPIKLRLPHPYLTTYVIVHAARDPKSSLEIATTGNTLRIERAQSLKPSLPDAEPPQILHSEDLTFTSPHAGPEENISPANNTTWARSRRSMQSHIQWTRTPTLGQLWLVAYALFTMRPELEQVRIALDGPQSDNIRRRLVSSSLALPHPPEKTDSAEHKDDVLLQREAFWQGAGSPFGEGAAWIPQDTARGSRSYILQYTLTTKFPNEKVHTWHPLRAGKPTPGAIIYSRYIPHLDEHFSMVAIDYENNQHLELFHHWQNDPRVAKGWNESGPLSHHLAYLKRMHEDPHQIGILAYFESTPFAYFEAYWGKEDHLGAYYSAGDFDRGRHSLVGDKRYRGRHRVTAWWSSLVHYLFLDDPRTMQIVGEPKVTNTSVLEYDLMTGFAMSKHVDLPHKRSGFMTLGRERFFQLCPFDIKGGLVGGTDIVIGARL